MFKRNAKLSVKPVHMTMCSNKMTINEPARILQERRSKCEQQS